MPVSRIRAGRKACPFWSSVFKAGRSLPRNSLRRPAYNHRMPCAAFAVAYAAVALREGRVKAVRNLQKVAPVVAQRVMIRKVRNITF